MHWEKENSSVHGLLVLFRKELADHLRSTRFLLMTALLNRSLWYVQTLWLLMPADVFPPSH